jgi:hypothetical protein
VERHAAAQSQRVDDATNLELAFGRPYQAAVDWVVEIAVELESEPSPVDMAVKFPEQRLSMDGESWAAVRMERASGREMDSTFAEASREYHILTFHERQFAESVLMRASLTVEFGNLISADTAGGQSPLGLPCFHQVLR